MYYNSYVYKQPDSLHQIFAMKRHLSESAEAHWHPGAQPEGRALKAQSVKQGFQKQDQATQPDYSNR